MKRILVTGATGFIGRHLVKTLVKQGYQVALVVRCMEKVREYFSEILKQLVIYQIEDSIDSVIKIENLAEFLEKNQIELVIHLATNYVTQSTIYNIDALIAGNITFGVQVLEAMKLAGVKRIVNTASSWQHYQNKEYCPVNVYAATKQAFEDILRYYSHAEEIHVITLEIYDTYGETDNRNKLIPGWKKIYQTGEEISLSAGDQKLDFVYIEDIITGIIRAMQLLENVPQNEYYEKKYALSSDKIYTLKEIAVVFEQIYHTKLSIQWGKKPYRTREVMEPYRELERLPGWEAKYTLQTGFQKMYQSEYRNK